MVRYWLWKISSLIWQTLPLRAGYSLASLVADIAYFAWPQGRAYARQNMARVLGRDADPRTVERLARQSLRNYCKYLVDFIRFPLLKPQDIESQVVFQGWENFDEALARGQGVILVGMHLGNWDLAAAAIALRRYPLNAIIEPFNPPQLDRMVQQTRSWLGLKVIPMEQATRQVLRALRQNEMLAILVDQPDTRAGVEVEFFGEPARFPGGAATLALRTGARVIPGGLVRVGERRFLGFIDSHIPFQPSGKREADIQALTQCIVSCLESWIRRYPDQYYMFRRLWSN